MPANNHSNLLGGAIAAGFNGSVPVEALKRYTGTKSVLIRLGERDIPHESRTAKHNSPTP